MTSTSVKDVGTVMNAFPNTKLNAPGAIQDASFQAVWNNQTGKNDLSGNSSAETAGNANQKTDKQDVYSNEALKSHEIKKAETPTEKQEVKSKTEEPLTEEELEEAMEVLAGAAGEMIQQIADTFNMTVEEVQKLLEEMDMTIVDVMNPEKLGDFILQAGGAEGMTELLTNEELCADFQQLMSSQKLLLADTAEAMNMTPEQLLEKITSVGSDVQIVDKMEMPSPIQEASDVVPVESEAEVSEDLLQNKEISSVKNSTKEGVLQTQNVPEQKETEALSDTGAFAKQEKNSDNKENPSQEHTGNLLLQNLKSDDFKPDMVQNTQLNSTWNVDTQDIMRQIMDYMRIQLDSDTSSLEMQLRPESLGTLQVHVASKDGIVTANFITQNEAVKAALESQMIQLKENFEQQGVKVEAIEVTVQTHEFERNLEQGRGRQQEEGAKKGRTRKIQLDGSIGLEDMEDLTEEDRLAAEMMTANGNTVDYTA